MKKIKFISIFILFFISFLVHFLYDKFPSFFTLIFAPVNESVWEHMKVIFTSIIIYSIFEALYFKKKNIKVNNYIFSIFISGILGIIFYLAAYIPLHLLLGHSMIIAIVILFLTFVLISQISLYLFNSEEHKSLNKISIILIIVVYGIFTYLSYNPIKNFLFYDTNKEKYGIDEYKK